MRAKNHGHNRYKRRIEKVWLHKALKRWMPWRVLISSLDNMVALQDKDLLIHNMTVQCQKPQATSNLELRFPRCYVFSWIRENYLF